MPQPVDANGIPKQAPAHKLVDETYRNVGYKFTITASQTNFFDISVPGAIIYLAGGTFAIKAANPAADIHEDDYAEFSVIDKDDVLGLFATYGLTVGVDVLELKKYVKTHYFLPNDNELRMHIEPSTLAQVLPGLYMRAAYHSHGNQDMDFYCWYDWFEV
jgi:hypothetical protein